MKAGNIIILTTLAFFTIFGCGNNDDYMATGKAQMKIEFEITPEFGDTTYVLNWKDTVGQSQGHYQLDARPREVWCVVISKKDTLGYYMGRSTPASFTYFDAKDTIAILNFMIGPNYFDDSLANAERQRILEGEEDTTFFRPIKLNIKNSLRRKLSYVLVER